MPNYAVLEKAEDIEQASETFRPGLIYCITRAANLPLRITPSDYPKSETTDRQSPIIIIIIIIIIIYLLLYVLPSFPPHSCYKRSREVVSFYFIIVELAI